MARYARRPSGSLRPRGPWKHGPIPVLGLIGGIGAGKSQVASALEAKGSLVLDADAVGHALLEQRPAREAVLRRFGPAILDNSAPQGTLRVDRRALGALVFSQPRALRDLEAILHPRMRRTFERAIARAARRGQAKAVVLDAAILLEAGWNALCDRLVFVTAPRATRLARLAAQRGWTDETLAAREAAQRPLEAKERLADFVINNDGDPEALTAEVERLWPALVEPPRSQAPGGAAQSPWTPARQAASAAAAGV